MFRIKRTQVAGELQKEVQLMAASNSVHFVGSHICKIQAIEINKSLSALSGVIEAGNVRCAVCSFRSLAVHKLGRLLAGSRSLAARLLLAGGGMFHTGLQTPSAKRVFCSSSGCLLLQGITSSRGCYRSC